MVTACREVLTFPAGVSTATLRADTLRLRAVERSLSILGEAAKRVPTELRERHPSIPWRAMAALRDVLVHDSFGVDLDVVEQVIRDELPSLLVGLERLCDAEGWERPTE
jgi:uncharacterized protein with HEPN domain